MTKQKVWAVVDKEAGLCISVFEEEIYTRKEVMRGIEPQEKIIPCYLIPIKVVKKKKK